MNLHYVKQVCACGHGQPFHIYPKEIERGVDIVGTCGQCSCNRYHDPKWPDDMTCKRCRKPFASDETPDFKMTVYTHMGTWPVKRGFDWYHKKCVPPNIFHRYYSGTDSATEDAGSLPAGPSLRATSLREQHPHAGAATIQADPFWAKFVVKP